MKQQMILQEQDEVNSVIEEIQDLIEKFESRKYLPLDPVEAKLEETRRNQLRAYEEALSNPYFGKLEVIEDDKPITYRIGKTGVVNAEKLTILDWRAPIGSAFYAFGNGGDANVQVKTSDSGIITFTVRRKRNVIIDKRVVQDVRETYSDLFEIEEIGDVGTGEINDPILYSLLQQRSGDHQLKEIIASIQKEQNEIIRLGMTQPILVQGVAGSGKTSIALHRVSYLLYHYQIENLQAKNVLVLAPNKIFLNYMREILKELEIEGIEQLTIDDLTKRLLPKIKEIRPAQYWLNRAIEDPAIEAKWAPVLKFKTSIRFYELAHLFMVKFSENFLPKAPDLTNYSDTSLDLNGIFRGIYNGYRHLPINRRREETIKSIKSWKDLELKSQIKGLEERFLRFKKEWTVSLPDGLAIKSQIDSQMMELVNLKHEFQKQEWDRVLDNYLNNWKNIDVLEIYSSLCTKNILLQLDPSISESIAEGIELEGRSVVKEGGRFVPYEDIGLILFLTSEINGLPSIRFDYMIVDEAQDYYPFLMRVLRELTRSVTLLGDVSQSIYSWIGIEEWDVLDDVFDHSLNKLELSVSYRSTIEIMELANRILKKSNLGVNKIIPVGRNGPKPQFTEIKSYEELLSCLGESVNNFKNEGYNRIAVITKDTKLCEAFHSEFEASFGVGSAQLIVNSEDDLKNQVIFIPASLVKGLEFEAVIIPSSFCNTMLDARLLFISVSRTQDALHILYYGHLGLLEEENLT